MRPSAKKPVLHLGALLALCLVTLPIGSLGRAPHAAGFAVQRQVSLLPPRMKLRLHGVQTWRHMGVSYSHSHIFKARVM